MSEKHNIIYQSLEVRQLSQGSLFKKNKAFPLRHITGKASVSLSE